MSYSRRISDPQVELQNIMLSKTLVSGCDHIFPHDVNYRVWGKVHRELLLGYKSNHSPTSEFLKPNSSILKL